MDAIADTAALVCSSFVIPSFAPPLMFDPVALSTSVKVSSTCCWDSRRPDWPPLKHRILQSVHNMFDLLQQF